MRWTWGCQPQMQGAGAPRKRTLRRQAEQHPRAGEFEHVVVDQLDRVDADRPAVERGLRTTFDVRDVRGVTDVLLDPDHRLLLRRQRGETVTFSIAAPEAKKVELGGSFTSQRIAATRGEDGAWRATLPLTAGRYSRVWFVDGERREDPQGDLLVVRPREAVARACPR